MEFRCSDSDSMSNSSGHLLVVSYPIQGHIGPLIKLSHRLADCRVKVTFVSTEFICERIMKFQQPSEDQQGVRIVPLPDGLEPEDDRKDDRQVSESIARVMPGHLEELIKKCNQEKDDEKITCVITDVSCGWALQIAAKMGLNRALVYTSAPATLALIVSIPKFIRDGVINPDGTSRNNEKIELSPNLPAIDPDEFIWKCPGNPSRQKLLFLCIKSMKEALEASDWILCNWFHELDPSANDLLPSITPIGPLLAKEQPCGNFWSEDLTCLSWLDKQPPGSVIYAAFGSISKFSQQQFNELALGLELASRPFLLVVRPGFTDGDSTDYPDGFPEKLSNLGKMVKWAPQEKVLSHPAVACYLTHCGWNSTMEGISMGVPFLCWPYFADQFYVKSCICDAWKIGLWLKPDDNGIVSRHEIKNKVDELLSSNIIRDNAFKLKELAQKSCREGGSSFKSLESFVKQIKK